MSKFKPGDYVVPLVVDRDEYDPEMKDLLGKVLQIPPVFIGHAGISIRAGKIGSETKKWFFWHPADLRMATAEEIEAAPAQKPLRRGDLVEYDGRVCVVFSDRDLVGHFFVSALSGVSDYYHCNEEELTRIGSIRKKVKRLKAQMEAGK